MRHIRIHLLASAALALSWQAAIAADMPMRRSLPQDPGMAPAPYYVPMFSWTGFYVGGNLGYGFGDGDGSIAISGVGAGPISGDASGFLGGVQTGYNWQAGSWVFGAEVDFNFNTAKGDITGSGGVAALDAEYKNPWFSTLRGRVGYAGDRWMGYITGGLAYGESELSGSGAGPGGGTFTSSETFMTWTLGAGVEYAMWDRWSTKLEYLYIASPDDVPVPPGTVDVAGDITAHVVRAGLNYRF